MKFNNKLLEQAVRDLLAKPRYQQTDNERIETPGVDTSGRELTEDDLRFVEGIIIYHTILNGYGIPWQGDGSAYQMLSPNLFISWDMVDWGDLKHFSHIKCLHAYVNDGIIREVPLGIFPNLANLYLQGVHAIDWAPLEQMKDLRMLCVRRCLPKGNQIVKHIGALQCVQCAELEAAAQEYSGEIPPVNQLDHLYLAYMDITDVSGIKWGSPWTDVNLPHNGIEDISPMESSGIYYLTLRHNKIKDVSALRNNACYLVNLRHNDITDITPLIEAKEHGRRHMSRLYLNYNPIQPEQLKRLAVFAYDFVKTDFVCRISALSGCDDVLRKDFTYGKKG